MAAFGPTGVKVLAGFKRTDGTLLDFSMVVHVANPDEPLPVDHGAWESSDAARYLLSALDGALVAAPAWCTARVDDVLVKPCESGKPPLLRCVECAAAGAAAPRSAAELANMSMSSWGTAPGSEHLLNTCDAVLLTHTFCWPADDTASGDGEDACAAPRKLCLRMVITTHAADTPFMQAALLGSRDVLMHATEAGGSRCACVVALFSGTERRTLSEDAVASLPFPLRNALKHCQHTQVLASLAACVRRSWLGGFLLLGDVAAPLLCRDAAAAAALQALTSQLRVATITASAAFDATLPPSTARNIARIHAAEALEALGEYAAAAELYKSCIDDDARVPGGVSPSPPIMYEYYGLALKRAGNLAGAVAAYRRGIQLVSNCHRMTIDSPEWRETLRLRLYANLINVNPNDGQPFLDMFLPAVPEMVSWNGRGINGQACFTRDAWGIWAENVVTGHRYAVVEAGVFHCSGNPYRLERIARLPDRVGAFDPVCTGGPEPGDFELVSCSSNEQDTQGAHMLRGQGAVSLPQAARTGTCAGCALVIAGMKRCAACRTVEYCSRSCQQAHWRRHKRACRAAVAAAAHIVQQKE